MSVEKRRSRGFFSGSFNADQVINSLSGDDVAMATDANENKKAKAVKDEIKAGFNQTYNIPVKDISAYEFQSRQHFDDDETANLAKSIKTQGLINPVILIKKGRKYEVISGERRLRACKSLGMDLIPARILTEKDAITVSVIDNLHRKNLHPLEEARDYKKLLESETFNSIKELAAKIGVQRTRVSELLGFLDSIPLEKQDELIEQGIATRQALRDISKNIEGSIKQPKKPSKNKSKTESLITISRRDGTIQINTFNDIVLSDAHKKALTDLLKEVLS